jgi:N-acetylglucosamine-6-phosphate deacetylase
MRLGVGAALVDGRLLPGDVDVDVDVDGVTVRAIGVGDGARSGAIAVAGFVDLQVNGFAGIDFAAADATAMREAARALAAGGVTAFQPTLVSAPEPDLVASVAVMSHVPGAIGVHLEGPFLSPEQAGAHDRSALRLPDRALLRRLLDAGPVSHVTLAPELPGALDLVDDLLLRGVTVACGHTDADATAADRAFDRGARTVTHLFNAMRLGTPREPGIALAALARADVTVQLIVDGRHLAAHAVLAAWRAAGGRLALVTDATAAAARGDGPVRLGARPAMASGGAVRLPDGTLAGTALTMLDAVRNLHALGVPLEQVLDAATAVPARIARRADLGRLAPGAAAGIVILDDRLEVIDVLARGAVSE